MSDVQLALFQDETIKKTIITVPVDQLELSEFNPRRHRPDEDIDKLAERISRNGFEITRALWVYRNGDGYKVFAGGTRLEAARAANVLEVPIILHEGLVEDDIVRLADEDNENDEYHAKVNPVDVWANYAWLYHQGWTQERIAEAKGLKDHNMVSRRLKLNGLPDNIKKFVYQGVINETHLMQISNLCIDTHFTSWLTTDKAQLELTQHAVKRHLNVRQTKVEVDKFRGLIETAETAYRKLKERQEKFEGIHDAKWDIRWNVRFVSQLAETKARTKAAINEAYGDQLNEYLKFVQEYEAELAKKHGEAEAERVRLEQEAEKNRLIQGVLGDIILGDFAAIAQTIPDESIDAIITDPPYPKEFLQVYETLAIEAARLLKPGGSLLVMCGQSYLPEIFKLMTPHIDYYWTFSYQTPGGQSPQIWRAKINTFWKPILWFVKGEYKGDWHGDVIKSDVNDNDKRYHHWGQSESGIARLVDGFSEPSQLVVDPFLGGGTVGVVALRLNRQFIGIDLDPESVETSKERIFTMLQEVDNG